MIGLDVGTAHFVAAYTKEDSVAYRIQRDAFIDIDRNKYTDKVLKGSGVSYVEYGGKSYVIGNDAFELANVFNRECYRPMKGGVISHEDTASLPMVELLVKSVTGEGSGETPCCFSVPADPVDGAAQVFYHKGMFTNILTTLGFKPFALNEGQAVIFSELADDGFTGIGISCGAGMVNVSVSCFGTECVSFSIQRAGDWINKQVASILGKPEPVVSALKESEGIDLCRPSGQVEVALSLTHKELIEYILKVLHERLVESGAIPNFKDPVPVVLAGGTSLPKGFHELFEAGFEEMDFPLKVREIRHAKDPLHAVARGCLFAAVSSEEDDD